MTQCKQNKGAKPSRRSTIPRICSVQTKCISLFFYCVCQFVRKKCL